MKSLDQFWVSLIKVWGSFKREIAIVIIPLLIAVCTNHETTITQVFFYIALLVLLFSNLKSIKTVQASLDKAREADKEIENKPKLEIVNRNKINSFVSYGKILNRILESERSVHIISPIKSKDHSDNNREKYLETIEEIVRDKIKIDSSFTYERLIPVPDSLALQEDPVMHNHFKNINNISNGLTNVYCQVIKELQSQYHFVMIDAKTIILFLPKYIIASDTTLTSDDCAFHLIIDYDKESSFLRYLRQQHNSLARNGVSAIDLDKRLLDQIKEVNSIIKNPSID